MHAKTTIKYGFKVIQVKKKIIQALQITIEL